MIDFNKLQFGDTVYSIVEKVNAFNRKKIIAEYDGYEWYRYDAPSRSYSIYSCTYVGKISTVVSGSVLEYEVEPEKFYIMDEKGRLDHVYADETKDDRWHGTLQEAKAEVVRLQQCELELQRS